MGFEKDYAQEHVTTKLLDRELITRLWGFLSPFRRRIYLAIFLLILSKAIEAWIPILIGEYTQQIFTPSPLENSYEVYLSLLKGSFFLITLLIIAFFLDMATVFLKSDVGQKSLFKLRTEVFLHIEKLPLKYFEAHSVGRLMTRTIHDVDQINQMFTESVVPLIGNLVLFCCMCGGIFYLNWQMGILMMLVLPMAGYLTNRFRLYQRSSYTLIRTIIAALNTFVQEHLMGAPIIRNFGLQHKELITFQKFNQDVSNAYLSSILNFSFFISAIDFMQNFSLIAVFALLTYFGASHFNLEAGTFFTFNLYALMFFRPLVDLAERYNVLQSAMAAAERIFDVKDQEIETSPPELKAAFSSVETIDFKDVWFAYEKENWILRGLTFHLKKGESLALVGETGVGKSTLMSLLLRFYPFQKGSIKINGIDINEFPLEKLRSLFGVVLQDPVIFSGTLFSNIALYDTAITEAKVNETLNFLKMRSFVEHLTGGLLHEILERGKGLSVGEKQLIALARVLAHDREILLLDEATANIDSLTEKVIQEALTRVLPHKTSLVIAHRLSTIQNVTRILVLHEGRVAESGTHEALLHADGIYKTYYKAQIQNREENSLEDEVIPHPNK